MKRRQGNIFILFNYIEEDEKDGCQDQEGKIASDFMVKNKYRMKRIHEKQKRIIIQVLRIDRKGFILNILNEFNI